MLHKSLISTGWFFFYLYPLQTVINIDKIYLEGLNILGKFNTKIYFPNYSFRVPVTILLIRATLKIVCFTSHVLYVIMQS